MSTLTLTQEWDKTFPKSELVNHCKYDPKECAGKLPAIAVSGPFGAVKEQSKSWAAMITDFFMVIKYLNHVTISYKTVPCFLPFNDYKRVLTMF